MDNRAQLLDIIAVVAVIGLVIGSFYGVWWVASSFAMFDTPDLECGDVDVDDERDLSKIVLYADESDEMFGDRYAEGALIMYEDRSYEVTGPLEMPEDAEMQFPHPEFRLYWNDSTYVLTDLHDRRIDVGPAETNENGILDVKQSSRVSYTIYETCEVTIA